MDIHRGKPQGRSHLLHLRPYKIQVALSELENYHRRRGDSSPADQQSYATLFVQGKHVKEQQDIAARIQISKCSLRFLRELCCHSELDQCVTRNLGIKAIVSCRLSDGAHRISAKIGSTESQLS
jgi:hypothetical protein